MLQEFDFVKQDKKGSGNHIADHLSRLPLFEDESFPTLDDMTEEALMSVVVVGKAPWFIDIANYLACGVLPEFESRAMICIYSMLVVTVSFVVVFPKMKFPRS